MKLPFTLYLSLLLFLAPSCYEQDKVYLTLPMLINCDGLIEGMLAKDIDATKAIMTPLLVSYPPVPVADDELGHEANLNDLVAELNSCAGLTAEIYCYACLESFPPQSRVDFTIDSAGVAVPRYMYIRTPGYEAMVFNFLQ